MDRVLKMSQLNLIECIPKQKSTYTLSIVYKNPYFPKKRYAFKLHSA